MFPTKGSKNSFSIENAGTVLGGNVDFMKYDISSTWYFPLPFDTVFSARGRMGYILATNGKDKHSGL